MLWQVLRGRSSRADGPAFAAPGLVDAAILGSIIAWNGFEPALSPAATVTAAPIIFCVLVFQRRIAAGPASGA